MTWGQRFRRMAADALEELAATEFGSKAVLEACRDRAAEGFTWCFIRPSRPVDVTKTAAVAALKAELAKAQLRLEWEPHREPDGSSYPVLRVSWEERR